MKKLYSRKKKVLARVEIGQLNFTVDPPLDRGITSEGQSTVLQNIPENFSEVGLPNIKAQQLHYERSKENLEQIPITLMVKLLSTLWRRT